jgi:hypothetical protein
MCGCCCRVVVIFDVLLLIMRDADLYDDLAIYVKQKTGRLGELTLHLGTLLVGPDLSSVQSTPSNAQDRQRMANWVSEFRTMYIGS